MSPPDTSVEPVAPAATPGAGNARSSPRVSVIMIFFNAGRFIDEAIRSVLAQTVEDWELVLVDDGSNDASRAIALSYVDQDPERIRICEHPGSVNRGTGPSRNLGMQMARGRYLAFLDADDVYEPRRLELCAARLDADPGLGVTISRDLYWRRWPGNDASGFVLPDEIIGPAVPGGRTIPPPQLIAVTLATPGAPMPAVCSITFRRAAFESLGGVPDGFESQYEDQALIVRLLLACSALVMEDCLARYRQHGDSLTHRARRSGEYRPGQPHLARRAFLTWVGPQLRRAGLEQPLLRRRIEDELAAPVAVQESGRHGGMVDGYRRFVLRIAALLPRRLVDAVIVRRWALKRQRVARRTAAILSTLERGSTS